MQLVPQDDVSWTRGRGPLALQLALATFGILALELTLIRWISGQIRIFAYFNNLILIGAFLGMGLGVAAGRRRPGMVHGTLPFLALFGVLLAFSERLGLVHMGFPDPSIHLWGSEMGEGGLALYAAKLALFLLLFGYVVGVFWMAGTAVGHLFGQLPILVAYGADLAGSLLGVLVMTGTTFFHAGPAVWLLIAALPFAWLSRRPASIGAMVVLVALGGWSARGATYSPYNRIEIEDQTPSADGPASLEVSVNRDFHQSMHDLSEAAVARDSTGRSSFLRSVYDLPYAIAGSPGRVLVVGAGTGNDVAAALRGGASAVISVDIDPVILAIGQEQHPEQPYADRRVTTVADDARAYFQQNDDQTYDLVVYGLLDSHAMFGALSTLRLDNYVYTREGFRSAWNLLDEDGVIVVSFSVFAGDWIADRLYWTLYDATGVEPLMLHHGMNHGRTFVVGRDPSRLRPIETFERRAPTTPRREVRITSDDWPFLYARPGVFPWGYAIVLSAVLLGTMVSVRPMFGGGAQGTGFDPVMFLMGAGFLLIETRGVTALSVLFGSTWMVNSAIFATVLLMVLAGNWAVSRFGLSRTAPWVIGLLASVVLLGSIDLSTLNALPLAARGLAGGMLHALPIGFAGVIVPILLVRSDRPTAALGSNLLGSVLGGSIEYLSMVTGLRALVWLAFAIYLAAATLMSIRARSASPLAQSGA